MDHDDFEIEPVRGLPETPPEGERILWQGSPDPWRIATRVYALKWVVGYFLILGLWRFVDRMDLGHGFAAAGSSALWFVGLAAITGAILYGLAWATAKAAVYTITNRRVAMRIGVALTLTLNLPFQWIESADLRRRKDGSGDIALRMKGSTKVSYLVLWPHAQPLKLNPAVPMLRGLKDADGVSAILRDAAKARLAELGPLPEPRRGHVDPQSQDDATGAHPVPAE
ncbi:hypothetical protein FHS89_000050 [Rubricella aquisinus]|uniref:YdbS-like PH domain-containing protein n=1 Tax=Rubricella aquisinus TaxID=2028108 RepID=A0A840WK53_9RHOB|nr:photosynthetic complex putative assembly protein PuhB [Rubricella aquisinus]MBB5514052.1 hypothetical protein [Rubricella aquisinus]